MTLKLKKVVTALLVMFIFIISSYHEVSAVDLGKDTIDLGTKTITDINKVWKLSFNSEMDISSMHENIQIKDITSGNAFYPDLTQGSDNSIIKISAPSGGYSAGHQYQLIIMNKVKSKKGKSLSKTAVLSFIVSSNNRGGSSNNNSDQYEVSAKVMVSPVVPIFKQITITSTNLPGAQKYKIEGNDNLINIGDSGIGVASGDSLKIYICDSKGNIIGTADMNVSVTKEDISLLINK